MLSWERDGCAFFPHALPAPHVDALAARLPALDGPGRRDLLDHPAGLEAARHPVVRQAAELVLGRDALAVRAILFDKTLATNWRVAWHQDLTIAVRSRRDVEGYERWSVKHGVTHVQPPVDVLESMVALRLHLDACDVEDGALRVVPGTHERGRIAAEEVRELSRNAVIAAPAPRGSLLLMRPLLLHASSPARVPHHRRVLHLEFARGSLPPGLDWAWRIRPVTAQSVARSPA